MYQKTKHNVMSLFIFNISPPPYLLLLYVQEAAPLASYNIRKMGITKCKYFSLVVLLYNNLVINTLRYLLFYNVKVPVLLGKTGTFVMQYRLFYMLKLRWWLSREVFFTKQEWFYVCVDTFIQCFNLTTISTLITHQYLIAKLHLEFDNLLSLQPTKFSELQFSGNL